MPEPKFHYVYILISEDKQHRYVGVTADLPKRLKKHNQGGVPHTAKFRPWKIETAIAFRDRENQSAYKTHLKSHSVREYAKRPFLTPGKTKRCNSSPTEAKQPNSLE